jgi:hydroxypyruvate isomerase
MQRRDFLVAGGVSLAGAVASAAVGRAAEPAPGKHTFKLKYAPHFDMFQASAGRDVADQLRFAADQGFTAWEDNGMKGRPVAEQEKIARTMSELGMTMGVFVAAGAGAFNKVTFAGHDAAVWDSVLEEIRESVDVAKRVNAKWMTVVPGHYDDRLEWDYQTANCIELLKQCSAIFAPHGMVMVLEPLNWWTDHPGLFLHKIPQAYQICRAVGSPACKILFDIYHQQITEGNLIPNMDRSWDEIAYFQAGDNPGRKEPGTGEINYRNVFKHIYDKGFKGVVGMEHGNSRRGKEGDQAVIDAYVAADSF